MKEWNGGHLPRGTGTIDEWARSIMNHNIFQLISHEKYICTNEQFQLLN